MPREFPRYEISLRRARETAVPLHPDTQKRRAIRRLRTMLALNPPHTRGEVRVIPPGKKRGTLIYQARVSVDGEIVVEEL